MLLFPAASAGLADQQALDFTLLHLLGLNPVPHHLLFVAHLRHETGHRIGQLLNCFGVAAGSIAAASPFAK